MTEWLNPKGLTIATYIDAEAVVATVQDNGSGMPEAVQKHIFEPFYQPNNQTHNLDLSITRAVIERHNGTIEVESEPGQGTTFTIHLPRM